MQVTLKPLEQQTLVITGASSGIGLATARHAVSLGARVVIVSRSPAALEAIAREIDPGGRQVLAAAADVGRSDEVERVAQAAIERFGGFDTWVNNAGVGIWGRLTEVPEDEHRRLFETNFWGMVNGSLVAARHLRGRGGAIVNVGSITGDRAWPLQGMYCASKHAIKGFTETLRVELEQECAGISITLIKPAAIGTPLLQHAANFTGRRLRLPPPIYAPEEAAHAICHAAQHPVRDVYVGGSGLLASTVGLHAPRVTDWISEAALFEAQLGPQAVPPTQGNLHRPMAGGRERGDDFGRPLQSSFYTRVTLHPSAWNPVRGLGDLAASLMPASRRRY
ncbi:SDR family oxidoreductase [Caldimonas tepidiphila]|uniref:SDR family oxidoreductase n=1 Tax=Caldimonas tepidiphila TaxID=2315841 RepID=UPI000E5B8EB2|nr:SDR family oxidoreductase [Caldimonas tepidiphila]